MAAGCILAVPEHTTLGQHQHDTLHYAIYLHYGIYPSILGSLQDAVGMLATHALQ
jgi:hypothetical protein